MSVDPSLKQSDVEDFVSFGIDRGVQPVSFVGDPNRWFVQRDLSRSLVDGRLWIGRPDPVVNGGTTPFDAQFLTSLFGIRT